MEPSFVVIGLCILLAMGYCEFRLWQISQTKPINVKLWAIVLVVTSVIVATIATCLTLGS